MYLWSFQTFLLLVTLLNCRQAVQALGREQAVFRQQIPEATNSGGKAFDAKDDIEIIEQELSRQDSGFQKLCAFPALIPAGTLKLVVSPRELHRYEGQPCCSSLPSLSLLGLRPPQPSPFYGVERIIHYSALDSFGPAWGQSVRERVTTLYENNEDFDPNHPNLFQSMPFEISAEGTFDDIQTFGRFDEPPPNSALQVLKQQILIENRVATTLYIVRTPQEIELIGYVEPRENEQQ